ncbi:MAG: hypothetical protein C5B52_15800 [Bacteroidetes bacterium]|nr:MAG: hypothetical protein C5B52_15800 [Bacteroidota bacterium]
MKFTYTSFLLPTIFVVLLACKKGSNSGITSSNQPPLASLAGTITSTNPLTVKFTVAANDPDNDPLSYTWDFGLGSYQIGNDSESVNYEPGKSYTIKVSVSDGKNPPVVVNTTFSTSLATLTIDNTTKFQTIEGFGGFGAKDAYWGGGPFTSSDFVNTLINDLGLTILRDDIPTNFEITNDNSDPYMTDLTKYNLNSNTAGHDGKLADHLPYLQDMKTAGLDKLIVSIWSPAPWMKYNNNVGNGTSQNAAPPYTTSPDATTNQLKTDMYQEFAEMCVAYIKIIKQQTGIDVYALSIQNEPRFSQSYASCVYNGEAMRDVIKVVGKRFQDEAITTKLFVPEDVGWFDGANAIIQPILADPEARQYVSFIATHGYAFDGVTASSTDAQTWTKMYNWGAPYNKELWMTETSGFSNDFAGAMKMAKAMYTAFNFGNVSAWVHWALSTSNLDEYSLMSSSGTRSKRYYVSKNFYRYIRPGAVRIKASVTDNSGLYVLSFENNNENSKTIVIINDTTQASFIDLAGQGVVSQYNEYVTSADDDCKDYGVVNSSNKIFIPASSVVTLYKKN